MDKFLLSIDQGTTGTKVLLVNQSCGVLAKSYQKHKQYYPQPGWVEHDPTEIWEKVKQGVADVLAAADIRTDQIEAVGLDNQGETVMFWDSEMREPLGPAVVWSCRRSNEIAEKWKKDGHWAERISQKTGLLLDPYFSATKIRWMMENRPIVKEKLDAPGLKCGTLDTWMIWNMTNGREFKTDPSTAGRTLLYNIHSGKWDDDILRYLSIRKEWLPEISPTVGNFGVTDPERFCGIEAPIKVSLVDQPAALYGHLCVEPGASKCTYGTGCFSYMNVGTSVKIDPENHLLSSIVWEKNDKTTYALDGSVYSAGSSVNFGTESLGLYENIEELQKWSNGWLEKTPEGKLSHSLLFIPSLGGIGAPYWNPEARGMFIGMSYDTTKADMARAILEGIAHRVSDIMEQMEATAGIPLTSLKVDGGLTNNQYLMQFQADLLGIPIEVPMVTETTAMGVAFLLGEACKWWVLEDLQQQVPIAKRYTPQISNNKREQLREHWKKAVHLLNAFYNENRIKSTT